MGQYNFHQVIDRGNTSSVKWDMTKEIFGTSDILPMWVADMDFPPPKEVQEALQERIKHGIFGYTFMPPSASKAIQHWLERRHSWKISTDWLVYHLGVVPAISTALQAFTAEGDKVMIQSPVYTPFFEMIKKNNRTVVNAPLALQENRYEIDFAEFENMLLEGVKLFLLCNPHNPGGRVWTEQELRRIGELCLKYNCLILSDEIHSDLIFKPNRHIPIASIDEHLQEIVITCIAPTKTFNLAGLQASAVVIPNEKLRKTFQDELGKQGFFTLNALGILGMETAYRYGENWLEELLVYLQENITITKKFIKDNLPSISVMDPDGTYLLWLNCRELQLSDEEIKQRLLEKGNLGLVLGNTYGPGGEGFVRINIACPQEILLDGLKRLKKAFS